MSTQVVATALGGPEALTLVHEDVPAPTRGQVSVAVRAVGMNPLDFTPTRPWSPPRASATTGTCD